jgi:uncharacterized protein YbjT (DUF2867 family)
MIGIIGGTGITGSQVVAALKAKGADFTCIVRDPDAAKAKLGDVKTRKADLTDPASLDEALKGISSLYVVIGHSPMLEQMGMNALQAAKKAGVNYFVYASGSEKGIAPDGPSAILQAHYAIEQAVKNSGMTWAIVQPNYFMSTMMMMAEPIAKMSKMITALSEATVLSMIHPSDVGDAAAEILTKPDKYAGNSYYLSGPELTIGGAREIFSKVLGREIEYMQVPPEAARKAMEDKGMPDWLIAHVGGLMAFIAKGGMAGVSDNVEKIAGHPRRTFDEWVSANKGAFGG